MTQKSLYEQAMGTAFNRLPRAVRSFHQLSGSHELHGWVDTDAPTSWAAQWIAHSLGTPRQATSGAIRFELHASPDAETWIRHFPMQIMSSNMHLEGNRLVEKLGAARLFFDLREVGGTLEMHLKGLRFLGLPCPSWLLPRIVAREEGHADRLYFRVLASLPIVGTVAGYHGHLVLPRKDAL